MSQFDEIVAGGLPDLVVSEDNTGHLRRAGLFNSSEPSLVPTFDQLPVFDELPLVTFLIGFILALGAILSRVSRFMGVPAGLLFLVAGMMLGEDGPGGIHFFNYELTYEIASTALGLILFHGGLSTQLSTLRCAWRPALVLATVGVLGVTVVTGLGVWGFGAFSEGGGSTLAVALLIGAILGSTDAAAVFDLLAKQRLKGRAREILEVESGLNDPMAFVLVFALTDIVVFHDSDLMGGLEIGLVLDLLWQLIVGGLIGLAAGWIGVHMLRLVGFGGSALYPVLTMAIALVTLGFAGMLGSSGLLAAYLAGMVIGNKKVPFLPTTERVHDTVAWLSQITMFFLLGLLVTPSSLAEFVWVGLAAALWVAFLARPLVVSGLLFLFRIPWRENILISFAGLRGAVPIILATVPVLVIFTERGQTSGSMAATDNANIERLFGFIFMVVVVGSIFPGALVRPLAKWLNMRAGEVSEPAVEIDLVTGEELEHQTITYRIAQGSRADGVSLQDIALPDDSSVLMVIRGNQLIPARGMTQMRAGDHVTVVYHPRSLTQVEGVFAAPQDRT